MRKRLSLFFAFIMIISLVNYVPKSSFVSAKNNTTIIVHYNRSEDNYDDWNLWLWPEEGNGKQYDFLAKDDYGKVAIVTSTDEITKAGFIVRKGDWEEKDIEEDRFIEIKDGFAEIWLTQGDKKVKNTAPEGAKPYDLNSVKEKPSKSADASAGLKVKIHYYRFGKDYDGWNLWLWPKDKDGSTVEFNGTDDYGVVCETVLPGAADVDEFGFIVKLNDWEARDGDQDRFVQTSKKNEAGVVEIYLVQDNPEIFYDKGKVDLSDKFTTAKIDSLRSISFSVTSTFDSRKKDVEKDFVIKDNEGKQLESKNLVVEKQGEVNSALLIFNEDIALDKVYTISHEKYGKKIVTIGNAYKTESFSEMFTYWGNDLGAKYEKDKTVFRLWAPTANKVALNLYKEGSGDNLIKTVDMKKDINGTWVLEVKEDLKGKYYTHSVTFGDTTNEAVDPYAKAVGVNGMRAMVIDLNETNPMDWKNDKKPKFKNYSDAIVYETHVRDFSIDKSSGIKNKGKYLGLTEAGTKNKDGLATGLDHLKDLGVTHVQLLPVYDYYTVDESKLDTPQFNWGYDPQNYNVPEGSYSSDPTKGEVRIKEFKEMVQALHKNDIRVIMDVVYNHTGKTADSNFNLIVPGYYYRTSEQGEFSNGSGCGNETASERSMVKKFMVDSILHWVKEYHIDGFRFDLMGIHDIETMKQIREEVNKIDPSIIIYGEGWTGGNIGYDKELTAYKKNIKKIDGVGAFSDDIRDGLKGSVFQDTEKGFISGAEGKEEWIKFGVVGAIQNSQIDYEQVTYSLGAWAKYPYQSVNYAEAHDNMTLWDRLATSNADDSEEDRIKMDKLAAGVVLTSQGVSFLQLGQDFLRTKPKDETGKVFDHNSYKSSDFTNSIKWDRKTKYKDVYEYYKGLIAFRNAHSGLRMVTANEVNDNLKFMDDLDKNMVGYTINNNANNDLSSKIVVVYNANKEAKKVNLPHGKWDVFVDNQNAGTKVLKTCKDSVDVEGISMIVLAQNTKNVGLSNIVIIIIISAAVLITLVIIIIVMMKRRKIKKVQD